MGEVVIRWAEPLPITGLEGRQAHAERLFFNHVVKSPYTRKLFPEPKNLKTLLDVQKAWVKWAKNTNINVSIRNEPAHKFIRKHVWRLQGTGSETDTTPLFIDHLINPLMIKGIHYEQPTSYERKVLRNNRLIPTEGEFIGKNVRYPFHWTNINDNYYDERFFDDHWLPFWKKMEVKSKEEGYKSLDGYCLDIYSQWCREKHNAPFHLYLNPNQVHHHVKFFKRTIEREFGRGHTLEDGSPIKRFVGFGRPQGTKDSWTREWEYINFTVRWMLVFEVWKDEGFTSNIRKGHGVHSLDIVKEDGFPYRISFDYNGSVLNFIDKTIEMYNGDGSKCYIGARLYGNSFIKQPQIYLHL